MEGGNRRDARRSVSSMSATSSSNSITSPNSSGSNAGNVKVVCRIRPHNEIEDRHGGRVCVGLRSDTEIQVVEDGTFTFTFDRIFGPQSTQEECFDVVAAPIVADILEGYNATIFAYGQTSSGKTYTMEGPSITNPETRGIIPRTVSALFDGVLAADSNLEFTVKVSYIEIYMERIRDLLDQFRTKVNLSVREDPRQGIYVAGVTEEYCTCEEELLQVMQDGTVNRATAATGMNEGSSRSHSVFMVTVAQRHLGTSSQKSGKLFLVDLAGSEMVRKTNATGQQLEEAKTINKSLSALGLVINALTDGKATHIPYRDSKLTRVLQDSLGGNAKTALVINCSPSSYNVSETLSTLRFGWRAKSITNKPKINEQRSVDELTALLQKAENAIDMQQNYILALEAQLKGGGAPPEPEATGTASHTDTAATQAKMAALAAELSEEREEVTRRGQEVEKLTILLKEKERLLVEASELMKEAERHCEVHRERVETLEVECSKTRDEFEGASEQFRAEKQKFDFEGQELRVRVETLSRDNERLLAELEEKEALGTERRGPGALLSPLSPAAGDASVEASPNAASPGSQPPADTLPRAESPLSPQVLSEVAERLDLTQEAVAFIQEREALWSAVQARWQDFGATASSPGEYRRILAEIEAQRAKLAQDLQLAAEKNMELEMQLSQIKATGPEAQKLLIAREKNHMKTQKKMEYAACLACHACQHQGRQRG
mmetsp:Transcript_4449/g.13275  ORF Transcript_4449/g.13275 Transcript_4449/m.13275 type:complete len:720 (-) Transcript_4449:752-2911(-)